MAPKRVLVVDDNEQNLAALYELFKAWGYEPEEADSGERAIRVSVDRQPEMAVVDLSLADCDIFDLIRILKVRGVRVIAYSGWHKREKQALAAGADAFVLKPDIERLELALRTVPAARTRVKANDVG